MNLPLSVAPLTLRRFQPGDLAALQTYRADPEVARFQSWEQIDDAQAARFIAHVATAPVLDDGQWCQLAIADENDHLIGDIGVHFDAAKGQVELGITLARSAQNQGWGTRMYRAAIAFVLQDTRVTQILGASDARNTGSLRMLEKAGLVFSHAEQNTYDGERCTDHVYTLGRAAALG